VIAASKGALERPSTSGASTRQEESMKRWLRAFAALAVVFVTGSAFAAYPERPITLIVPWGAGGGTDAVARFFGAYLEKELGQPVNVVNRTGGNGVVGHSAIAQAAPDGYTIGLITVEITMMHWQGLTELGPGSYTPLALVNADPAGFQVRADSAYKTVKDVLDAVKANPGKLKASGTGQGGIWQLALAGLLSDLKIDPKAVPWVPSNGAAPGLQDLVAGGVDIVPCSIPEARALIDAGKVRWRSSMRKRQRFIRACRRSSRRPAATGRPPRGADSQRRKDCRRKSRRVWLRRSRRPTTARSIRNF
jgi:tripartite-type tricarboxylate transporter receptor subunit TctC